MFHNDKSSPSSKQEERLSLLLWFRLSRFYNQSLRRSNFHLKKWGLTVAQFDVLVQIGTHQPLTQKELAAKLFVTKGNMTQVLGRMEELGWIKREQEWKTKVLSLTNLGKEMYEDVVPHQEQFQASQFQGLTKEEQKQLLDLLRKLQHQNNNAEELE
ncbi:DNA-binding MarR family transcriptional regulator [Salibacterium salarium]|uniref:MarR family winged helix-turn-helix transcriptional regulator n=1 Tax=Salibacterium salarium TaxID=284579 RepID=UPI00278B29B1|nr:MarR family transcriptional regulator [Salibacterium salarium]MDQ0300017.1 DNA-binding MarR family transcriptional regulator [Salibacterium salarium]